jgi:hypothetical protein
MRFLSRSLVVALAATAVIAAPAVAFRGPGPVERQGINKTLSAAFGESRGCFARDLVRVSTVDRRYALWSGANGYRQAKGCLVGDGFIIMRRQANGSWTRRLDSGWDLAPCAQIGSRVARDLTRLPCSR